MSYSSTAANVAANKERHPELYCPVKKCLWRTGDSAICCPKHKHLQAQADAIRAATSLPQCWNCKAPKKIESGLCLICHRFGLSI